MGHILGSLVAFLAFIVSVVDLGIVLGLFIDGASKPLDKFDDFSSQAPARCRLLGDFGQLDVVRSS